MKISTRFFNLHMLLGLTFIFFSIKSFGQPGKDGNLVVTTANTVLNSYSGVVTDINAGDDTIAVFNVASDFGSLVAGDLIMIYQAQGASINTTNTISYGEIISYNSAGLYEFAYVTSVSGNMINLGCGVTHSYTVAGRTQVVKIPQYNNLTINAGGSVTASPWEDYAGGRRGGLVIIDAVNVTVEGAIDASGLGFRGGLRENSTSGASTTIYNDFVTVSANLSAEKGESIAGYGNEYDGLGGRYGRGAPANGGGGGNAHNSGGGGGANGNNGVVWLNGNGNMCSTCTGAGAWTLDPDYITNGNALTESSGGGRGGYSYSSSNQDALTVPPSDNAWAGDRRDNVGGLGGRSLVANEANRIFFGGGGGAGDSNNSANQNAANGAGIILIRSNQINGTGNIIANGQDGSNTIAGHNDAPSGAGAGGSIILKSVVIANTITLNANGGIGGNQLITGNEAEGPGGGGSGGFVAITAGSPSISINGGTSGITGSASLTEFPVNGATDGAPGEVFTSATNPSIVCIDAVDNDFSLAAIDNTTGGNTATVYNNDTLFGVPFADGDVTPSIIDNDGIVGLVINSDGTLTVPASTPTGTYTVEYQICETADLSNCDTAFVTIVVNSGNIDAVDNDFSATTISDSTGGNTASVYPNDTLNSAAFANTDVIPGITDDDGLIGVTINSDGTLTVPANTPNGTYDVEYEICEAAAPTNCDVAIATIVVFDSLISNDDDFSATTINDFTGGTTTTVYVNDTLNGVTVTASDVTPAIDNDGGLTGVTINADGTIDVPAGSTSGTYTVTYEICETANLLNCTTSDVIIVVADSIIANDDDFSSNTSAAGTVTSDSVYDNDTLNGATVATGDVDVSITADGGLTGVTINADGTLNIPSGATPGTYTLTYEICQSGISNCDTANVIIVVEVDTDGDGVVDSADLDDDNDGISDIDEEALCAGSVQYEFYDSAPSGSTVDNIPTDTSLALSTGIISDFDTVALQNILDSGDTTNYSIRFTGNINVTTAGLYTFYTSSDDGSKLFIDGTEIVDNDGGHGTQTRTGTTTLAVGLHQIIIEYFQGGGGRSFTTEYQGPGVARQFIPFASLSCQLDTDGDGIPNQLDLDSDNDGIYDVVESGGTESASNIGQADGAVGSTTTTNGIPSSAGIGNGAIETTLGTPDYLNLDSDGDGCSDANEAYDAVVDGNDGGQFGMTDPSTVDMSNGLVTETGVDYSLGTNGFVTDGNFNLSVCYVDPCDALASGNTDADGDNVSDSCDLDDDNDGILDSFECPATDSGLDGSISGLTFDVTTNNQNSNTEAHVLNSITISGIEYSDFVVPSRYSNTFSGVTDAGMIYITENNVGQEANLFSDTNTVFNAAALSAFQDRNLNHFQVLDNKDYRLDAYSLNYSTPVLATDGMFIAITERNGNNQIDLEAFDSAGNSLGTIFVDISDYIDTGYNQLTTPNQNVNIAVFPLDDLAIVGSEIITLRVSFPGGASDGPDGKVFIFGNVNSACDSDRDGVPNQYDLDSDNDGIYDVDEAGNGGLDSDNNGIIDVNDTGFNDSNGNGTDDTAEGTTPIDTLNDSIYDFLNTDSDGDSCPDANEAYSSNTAAGSDNGQFGEPDGATINPLNGLVIEVGVDYSLGTNAFVVDEDYTLSVCYVNPCNALDSGNTDSDGDGITNLCDADDDNDGILDIVECPATDSGVDGAIATLAYDITTNNQNSPTEAHVLNSITISGVEYSDFVIPDSFNHNFYGVTSASQVYISENNIGETANLNSDFDAVYNTAALSAFQDRNLNHSQFLNNKNFNSDFYDIGYNTPIISTDGMFIALTERAGNNSLEVEAFDINGNSLGVIFVPIADYVDTGYVQLTSPTQNVNIAVYPLDDLAPVGSEIVKLRISLDAGNTSDGPDGKVFIFGNVNSACDSDGDGVPNQLDLDSDNDGIYDVDEAGNGNLDSDNDGDIDNDDVGFNDGDGNGADDTAEATTPIDTLNDGSYDYQNTDSDGDGCSDANEAYSNANADGGDGGQFGAVDPATVNLANGLVIETGVDYSLGTNSAVVDENDASSCSIELTVTKTTDGVITPAGVTGLLGDTIDYTITVSNTGNTIISNIEVTDADVTFLSGTNPITSLAPGVSVTVTVEQTISQSDLDAGF
ncbi:PA14 domain-containing protein, partial [uncultured Winogradskyella sp.]|uniref:beta strand repeat-containing protein n=1 Tax=uncultured Winogradskyella sp. TaxID=395353 RepID=UPI00263745BE